MNERDNFREGFWERVNAAHDARRDPLRDEGVRESILRRPELLGELAALDQGLARLAPAREHSARRRRVRRRAAFAAAALLVALGAFALQRGSGHEQGARVAGVARPEPRPSRVLAFTAEVSVTRGSERVTCRFDGQRTETSVERDARARGQEPAELPRFVASIESWASSPQRRTSSAWLRNER